MRWLIEDWQCKRCDFDGTVEVSDFWCEVDMTGNTFQGLQVSVVAWAEVVCPECGFSDNEEICSDELL